MAKKTRTKKRATRRKSPVLINTRGVKGMGEKVPGMGERVSGMGW
jgi:hypothetical protein